MPGFTAVTLLALSLFAVTFAVNLQAPLYSSYVAGSGLGATAVTIGFAAYVGGLMPTLMFLGGLSDRIGRRVPIFLALCMAGIATTSLALYPNWNMLVLARCFLGIGTGLATTAGTAYMTEILGEVKARKAALFVTSGTSLGFGGGALATGISLSLQRHTFVPASFIVFLSVVPFLAVLVLFLPKVDLPKKVSLLRLPVFPPGTWVYGTAMALAWSATGMTIAVVPLQLEVHGLGSWTGLVIFLAIFMGFLCQPLAKSMTNITALSLGFLMVPLGFLTLLVGSYFQSIALVLAGTAITSAASYGFTYLSALSEFSMRASDNRARAVAGLYVYAYVGFSVPVIASGALADSFGLTAAMSIFCAVLILITVVTVACWISSPFPTEARVGKAVR